MNDSKLRTVRQSSGGFLGVSLAQDMCARSDQAVFGSLTTAGAELSLAYQSDVQFSVRETVKLSGESRMR
jgi:hypothetical protein